MSEYLSIYLREFQSGLACSAHKKRAGVSYVKTALLGKAVGGVSAAVLAALGINSWPKIEKIMPSYATGGALAGGAIGAGIGMMKDSDVPRLDPNAIAVMTDKQRDKAKKEYGRQRRGESIRRGLLGGLKGGVGGAIAGSVGAIGHGTYQQIQEEGVGVLRLDNAIKTIGDWLERQKEKKLDAQGAKV